MIIIGIDPGLHGAVAVVDAETCRVIEVVDITTYETRVGKKVRSRLDEMRLLDELRRIKAKYQLGAAAELIAALEEVGPMPKDGAVGAFAFGSVYGEIKMALKACGYRVEGARPQEWKKALKVPALKSAAVSRADEIFPLDRHLWRGTRGGALADRAEAAMIAKYGGDKWLPFAGRKAA